MEIVHPNLYFNAEDIAKIKKSLEEGGELGERYKKFVNSADSKLKEELLTEEYANSVYSQHGEYYAVSNQITEMAKVLGLKYAVEGDIACAEKLKEALLHFSKFKIWTGPENLDRKPAWHSGLESAGITVGFAIGYDIIYDYLTEEERDIVADALINTGIRHLMNDWILPGKRIHALDSMGHNWWAVCVGRAGVAILPVADRIPEAEEWLSLIDEALYGYAEYKGAKLLNKQQNYDDRGLFYESISYFNFGAGEHLFYIYHRERYLGKHCAARHPVMSKMADAILAFSYPTDEGIRMLNYGDSSTDTKVIMLLKHLILCGYSTPSALAYMSRVFKDCEDLTDVFFCDLYKGEGTFDAIPKFNTFEKTGYSLARSSWENNATLFSIKSGFTWNHAHEDAGSIILYSNGKPLIIDSGTCSYGHKNYHGYYFRAAAHNVVMLGGENQDDMNIHRGIKFPGSIVYAEEPFEGIKYICADVTGPLSNLCGRNFRNVIIIDDKHYVIIDDIYTHKECTSEALFHYAGEATIGEGKITIDNGGVKAFIMPVYPAGTENVTHTGHPEGKPDEENEYIGIFSNEETDTHHLINVISLEDEKITRISGIDSEGVALGDTEVTFNIRADGRRMHWNSNNTLSGIDTDAYISVKRGNKAYLVYSSYARIDGKSCFESFVKSNNTLVL